VGPRAVLDNSFVIEKNIVFSTHSQNTSSIVDLMKLLLLLLLLLLTLKDIYIYIVMPVNWTAFAPPDIIYLHYKTSSFRCRNLSTQDDRKETVVLIN
jgi:hypothetical protein